MGSYRYVYIHTLVIHIYIINIKDSIHHRKLTIHRNANFIWAGTAKKYFSKIV